MFNTIYIMHATESCIGLCQAYTQVLKNWSTYTPDCVVREIPASNPLWRVYKNIITKLTMSGHNTILLKSTQPSTLCEMVKWLSIFEMTNKPTKIAMVGLDDSSWKADSFPSRLTWFKAAAACGCSVHRWWTHWTLTITLSQRQHINIITRLILSGSVLRSL